MRSPNAQTAVDLYNQIVQIHGLTGATAWHGIARLLLTTSVWRDGIGWVPFHDFVVYRERNDFKTLGAGAPNTAMRRAEALTAYLASQLGVPRADISSQIGLYWKLPEISTQQPHNLLGHAFRSLIVTILEAFGDPGIKYQEEVDPHRSVSRIPFRYTQHKRKDRHRCTQKRASGGVAVRKMASSPRQN